KNIKFLAIIILILDVGFINLASAQHDIPLDVVGSGGDKADNGTHAIKGTIGQSIIGHIDGTNYDGDQGFWYQDGTVSRSSSSACGNITTDTTWDADTVLVTCEVTVDDGVTLTIEPGVLVEFQGHYKLNVQGRLLAEGTVADTITFTVADTTGFSDINSINGGWHGIRFYDTSATNDTSKIVYCTLKYGKATDGISGNNGTGIIDDDGGAINVRNFSKVIISNCNISYNSAAYLGGGVHIKAPDLIFQNNLIANNKSLGTSGGIYLG
ncbi:MAG: hypothetical protein GY869_06605, partial [Planctomycetes bacterium]|nr:hypothetical protein [Planctomycetota bacterium]